MMSKSTSRDPRLPVYQTIEEAASSLGTTPDALRARCRRAEERRPDGSIVAPLAPGVVAVKFGTHWRVRFDVA